MYFMSKLDLLKLLLLLGGFYLVVQAVLMVTLETQNDLDEEDDTDNFIEEDIIEDKVPLIPDDENVADEFDSEVQVEEKSEDEEITVTSLQVFMKFLVACAKSRLHAFLMEPAFLKCILINVDRDKQLECIIERLERSTKRAVAFGVQADGFQKLKDVVINLKTNEFYLLEISENDPRLLFAGSESPIPTHYLFTHVSGKGPVIHLVIFYERLKIYFWHGAMQRNTDVVSFLGNKSNVKLTFGKSAGAYEKFKLRPEVVTDMTMWIPQNIKGFIRQMKNADFVECNQTRTRDFFAEYGDNTSPESVRFQRKARQIIAKGKQLLDDLGIPFWLSSGTCLGWYRQCGIIPYTRDVDFGIWIKDYKPTLISTFQNNGFPIKHLFGKVSDSYELSFQNGEVKLDIFFFYEEDTHMWNGGTQARTGKKFKYYFPKFTLCWTELMELRVRVPCESEQYLEANYGKNWFEPVKVWDWKKSPPNVKENGVWPEEEWEELIQTF